MTVRSDSSSGRLSVSFAVSVRSALIASFVLRRDGLARFTVFGLRALFFIARRSISLSSWTSTSAIIGGGIVGLACAAALARAGKTTVTLERHRTLGSETTSRSSEVIHAGLYYTPGSLKATTCVRGAELLYEWCASHGVPHARCGKLVVATSDDEMTAARRDSPRTPARTAPTWR